MGRRSDRDKIRSLLKITILLFSLFACFVAIKTSTFLNRKELHKENFVNVKIIVASTYCKKPIIIDKTGSCVGFESVILEASASGIAIKTIDNDTYILTAAHFCEEVINEDIDDESNKFTVTDIWATGYDEIPTLASVVNIDEKSDLCLLKSSMLRVDTVKFSPVPQIGEKVYTIASPLDISEDGILLHFEGFFSGCDSSDLCFYTIPATFGSSGSIVFDRRGRAIGMIQMVPRRFDSISMGTGYISIKEFLKNSSNRLNVDLDI